MGRGRYEIRSLAHITDLRTNLERLGEIGEG
jgi:hypothetical protein